MATFWDLPLEIRTQIYHLLIDWEQYFCFGSGISVSRPKIHKIDPSILRVNKRLSDDAGSIFYRDNLVELWAEVDYDKRDTIDIMLDAALVALTDKEAGPRSWKCRITIHVSYGDKESEFYEGRLIMYKEQAKFPSLSGAAHAKEISEGWRSWFSGGNWHIRHFYVSRSKSKKVGTSAPMDGFQTRREGSWKVGSTISGDDFVEYLERLIPPMKHRSGMTGSDFHCNPPSTRGINSRLTDYLASFESGRLAYATSKACLLTCSIVFWKVRRFVEKGLS